MYRIVFAYLLFYVICTVYGEGPAMGEGVYDVYGLSACTDKEYPYTLEINTTREDRDTIKYDAFADLLDEIDEFCSIKLIICIYKDGGCKPYQTLSDDSLVRFAVKYAEKFVDRAFKLIDLPDWPIPKGKQTLASYVINNCEFPLYAPYGEFKAVVIIIKNGEEVICSEVDLGFKKDDDGICSEK